MDYKLIYSKNTDYQINLYEIYLSNNLTNRLPLPLNKLSGHP